MASLKLSGMNAADRSKTDVIVNNVLSSRGLRPAQVPDMLREMVRAEVTRALASGERIDPAAILKATQEQLQSSLAEGDEEDPPKPEEGPEQPPEPATSEAKPEPSPAPAAPSAADGRLAALQALLDGPKQDTTGQEMVAEVGKTLKAILAQLKARPEAADVTPALTAIVEAIGKRPVPGDITKAVAAIAPPQVTVDVKPTPIMNVVQPAPVQVMPAPAGGTWEVRIPGRAGEPDRVMTITKTS